MENRGRTLKKKSLNDDTNSPNNLNNTNKFYSRSVSRNDFLKNSVTNRINNNFDIIQKTNIFNIDNDEENGREKLNNIESGLKRRKE